MVRRSSSAGGVRLGGSADSGLDRIWKHYFQRPDHNYKQLNHDGITIEHSDRNNYRHDPGQHCRAVRDYARNNPQPERHYRNRHDCHDSRIDQEQDG